MNFAGDTLAKQSRRTPRGRFGLPRDVWWGSITALVVFVLAPFALTVIAKTFGIESLILHFE